MIGLALTGPAWSLVGLGVFIALSLGAILVFGPRPPKD